jgi:hypothetical protein
MKKIILGIIIGFVIVGIGGLITVGTKNSELTKKENECDQKGKDLQPVVDAFETELNKRSQPWGIKNKTELAEAFYSKKYSKCLGVFHIHLELENNDRAEFIARLFNYPTDKKDIYLVKDDKQESPLFTTDDKAKLDVWIKDNK